MSGVAYYADAAGTRSARDEPGNATKILERRTAAAQTMPRLEMCTSGGV
jgi:hypothetical protein